MIWFISDMHFSHTNVIKFSDRPFKDKDDMNETLIENWNKYIKDDDTVFHLGDFSFDNEANTKVFLSRLKGNINFLQGNHDKTLINMFTNKVITESRFKYLGMYYKLRHEKERFILFHYPIENWDGKYRDYIHIHGHSHFNFGNTMANRFDVGVEGIGYYPIGIDDIIFMKVKNAHKRPDN